ncbi:hypothetical protein [Streptomyces longisporoflavus]|uniref:hypothetical protein n=1 Tax=Streptomyces longisporoflavus TaxID=28044 RepID=UPI00167E764A|nr:hypothetical protein [Streptomyces longisporoflavus]
MTHRPPTLVRPPAHAAVAFRCEVTARGLAGSREVIVAHYRAASPRLAARWIRAQAQHLAGLLAPEATTPYLPPATIAPAGPTCPRPDEDLRMWASNSEWYEHAIRVLSSGNSYLLNVTDYDARYSVRAYALPTSNRPLKTAVPAGCPAHAPAGTGRHRKRRRWRT